jgi:hypothetical protein
LPVLVTVVAAPWGGDGLGTPRGPLRRLPG